MSYFPFMIELNNERCLIAGGGTVAYRKVCSMLEFGAVVTVVSPEFCPELLELAEQVNSPDKYCAEFCRLFWMPNTCKKMRAAAGY